MKELRFEASDGEWRAAFAFDLRREAIVLVAADKSGVSGKKFYKRLIRKADARYEQHIATLKAEEKVAASRNPSSKVTKNSKERRNEDS